MAGPLAGIRILDLSERSPSAAIAGMVLADLGAEVIRVEPPGGDPVRVLQAAQIWLRGQKSVTIGPEQMTDGSWVALRASADVIIDTAQPWTDKPSGLLENWAPGPRQVLAILTTTPHTVAEATGPRSTSTQPVYGELIESQLGFQDVQQGHREGPIFLGWPHATYGAAWLLQIGILGALYERATTGQGQVITTSLMDGMAALMAGRWLNGERVEATPLGRAMPTFRTTRTVTALFECGDGNWIFTHTMARGAFDRLMQIVGREDLVDPSITSLRAQLPQDVAEDLWAYLRKTFQTQPAQHWFEKCAEADVPCMIANPPGDALWLEQTMANGLVDVTPDGRRQLGKLAKFSRTPMDIGRSIPAPGEHTVQLLSERRPDPPPSARNGGPSAAPTKKVGPLEGLLVLDFGIFMAGPFSPRLLADLGARVIKIEEKTGDPFRGPGSTFLASQRGKESLAVDLKTEEGRAAVYELVRRADVVHHNMRAGAMVRLGMDYDTLSKINPRIIYCHSSGYGNEGPWAKFPAFEPLHSAATGILYRTGGQGNPPLMYLTHMDIGCGLTSTVVVLAALVEREHSGKGQYFEVPQIGAGLLAMSDVYFDGNQKVETFFHDSAQRGHAPTNALYRTQDGWIVLACYSEREWEGVRRALGISHDQWADYPHARQERVGQSRVGGAIEAALAELTTLAALRRLEAEGVPCTVPTPLDPARLLVDPRLRELGIIMLEQQPDVGTMWEFGHTIRFARATAIHHRPAPTLGQNTAAILREVGRSEAEIAAMVDAKVVTAADWHEPVEAAR